MPMNTAKLPPTRRGFHFAELKVQEHEQRGTFEGYLAVFGNEDQGGDIIEPGAFTKTLVELKSRAASRQGRYILPIFWGHDPNDPIGGFTDAKEDSHGLYVHGELDLDIEQGKRAYSGMVKGYCDGMSIGYFTMRYDYDRQARRHLKELSVFEGSITPVPMNDQAVIAEVKKEQDMPPTTNDAQKKERPALPEGAEQRKALDFATALNHLSADDTLQDEWGDAFQALVNALDSVMWSGVYGAMPLDGGDTFDAQDAADTILSQFSSTMSDLVKRSLAAAFVPSLDDDCDSFLDPDGPNAEGSSSTLDDSDYMSLNARRAGRKAGRTMSAANHKELSGIVTAMKKAMSDMTVQHKALTAFRDKVDPNAKPDSSGDATTSDDSGGAASLDTTSAGHKATASGGHGHSGAGLPDDGNTTPLTADDVKKIIRDRMEAYAFAQRVTGNAK